MKSIIKTFLTLSFTLLFSNAALSESHVIEMLNKSGNEMMVYSKKVLKIFQSKKKKLVVIKNGDHSLSTPKWLKILKKELKLIIN